MPVVLSKPETASLLRGLRGRTRRRADLVIENLALRQQVTALTQARPRLRLDDVDRAFWVALRHSWPRWTSRLLIVNPDTGTRWHRDRFGRSLTKISQRRQAGRPRVDAEIRRLFRRMARDGWAAPRIHAALTKLGFGVAEKTVSRYPPRRPTDADKVKRGSPSCGITKTTSPRWICSPCLAVQRPFDRHRPGSGMVGRLTPPHRPTLM